MNWNIVAGNWKQLKGRMRTQWGILTHHRIDVIAGRRIVLAGKAQKAFGLDENAADFQIKRNEVHRVRHKG